MDATYTILQHYWWLVISLLAAALVFLLFVQGGQSLLYTIGRTPLQRDLIVNSLGRKWELTFTTLVTFGGAFFASFPLFYSTSFSGAFYLWNAILLVFVIQAVAYQFRRKPDNFLGDKTYEWFLVINGVAGTFLLGVAVGTLFTGADFTVDRSNIASSGNRIISQWGNRWHGLEALSDYRNMALGIAVLFLSRILALQYFINDIDEPQIKASSSKRIGCAAVPFLAGFLTFFISLMLSRGLSVNPVTEEIYPQDYKYLLGALRMPYVSVPMLLGIVSVLYGIYLGWRKGSRKAIWWSGAGTVATMLGLMLLAGWNDTCYYPSLSDMQSSLNIYNSSSSLFTLTVMSVVSLIVPAVIWYISLAWKSIGGTPIGESEIKDGEHTY